MLEFYRANKFANNLEGLLVEQAIDAVLTDEEEQVIKLVFLNKKRLYEWDVANEMGVCDRTVRRIKARALNKLLIALSERLGEIKGEGVTCNER